MAGDLMKARLRVLSPDGEYLGFLLQPSAWEVGLPLNDVSSLRFNLHENTNNYKLINNPVDIALEVFNSNAVNPDTGLPYPHGAYQEFPNCRFLNIKQTGNMMSGTQTRDGEWQFEAPGYAWMMKKMLNVRNSEFDADFRRTFKNASVGTILQTFIQEARDQNNVLYFNENFSSTLDSSGNAWVYDSLDESFDPGQDLLSILQSFTDRGLCDWYMDRRTLNVFNPNTTLARDFSSNADRAAGTQDQVVVLRPYFDVLQEPTDVTREDLARVAIVHGDNKSWARFNDTTVPGPWGAWQDYQQAGGVSKQAELDRIAQRRTDVTGGTPKPQGQRIQHTKDVAVQDWSKIPVDQYRAGDYISAPMFRPIQFNDPDPWVSKVARMRIQNITCNFEAPYGIRTNLTLLDRFAIRAIQAQQWQNRVLADAQTT
jgi:hypothetical protein